MSGVRKKRLIPNACSLVGANGLAPGIDQGKEPLMYIIVDYQCECCKDNSIRKRIGRIRDEFIEFIAENDVIERDKEKSDLIFQISALISAVTGGLWRWVLPGGEYAYLKGKNRFDTWGCPRSERNKCS